jgi:hypothetical protein
MTRKDFKLIAETVKAIENKKVRKTVAEVNADACAKSNPRFDKSRFFAACGVSE